MFGEQPDIRYNVSIHTDEEWNAMTLDEKMKVMTPAIEKWESEYLIMQKSKLSKQQIDILSGKDLKQIYSDVNFIGIRIVSAREFSYFIRRYGYISETEYKKARKEKTYSIKESGYDSYFAIVDSALSNDDEFEVQEDASKAQIKRAFVKSLKAKKLNKKVLGEFVELVA